MTGLININPREEKVIFSTKAIYKVYIIMKMIIIVAS